MLLSDLFKYAQTVVLNYASSNQVVSFLLAGFA